MGVVLALLILTGASVAAALYFAARLAELPEKPAFPNDTPAAQTNVPLTTPTSAAPTPTPEPEPETLPAGAYRAVVVQPIGLILRDTASLESNRIGGISYEENVIVLEETEDQLWQKVQVEEDPDRTGWVRGGNTEALE
ncbi:MAG: SH3 domain-containing protein [Microcoleaceae cyanobacterium]